MNVRLLGELTVASGAGELRLAAQKQRALLALLALHPGEPLSRDFLVEQLWQRPPADPRHALEVQVSRLRRALRELDGEAELIVGRPGGYLLAVEPEQIDVGRVERLVREARQALAAGEPAAAAERLTAALAEWRGEPLAELAFEPFAQVELGRLEELRLSALEDLAEAKLLLGGNGELVAELEALVSRYPLRERLRAKLMLALYRAGRQAEALDLYQAARRLLVDELGIEPSQQLQQLQQQILRHDPVLEPPAGARGVETTVAAAPALAAAVTAAPAAELSPAAPRQQRKVVTILFCDVSESTALGERLDPEALRALLARYFERMKAVVERHGGTVEKFIGDAVMAVYGVPRLHEDDAVRACRAALEMREALPELGLAGRIGIATGEVVTGTEERLATGAAVNLAARLEQAAEPGEVLVAAETLQLIRASVEVEEVEPLALKGKAEPVPAYRLLSASADVPVRPSAPLVGRVTELRRLDDVFAQASRDCSCQLFTLLGPAGVGKTRLADEFLNRVEARVVRGRCLSYGDGITYWPVVEIVNQLRIQPEDVSAAATLSALLGESQQATTPEEIARAFRLMLEQAAAETPLVCLLDDLHWGEPALLDLVEYLADASRDAPILLLCLARPELLEKRAGWAGGKLNATTLLLEPLSVEESRRLLDQLGGVEPTLCERIVAAADGVPLFLEEMLALARESGDSELVVPSSIQALLAARLDQLDPAERALLERGAIEGKHFHQAAVEALAPADAQVVSRLQALVRRELIRPAKPLFSGGASFRFRHQLIRDAAYDALPKSDRVELHQRFADWIDEHGRELADLDELVGYHLEQACRYHRELDRPLAPRLAIQTRERLTASGYRAFWRSDFDAAANLFERAAVFLEPDQLDVGFEISFATALTHSRRFSEGLARNAAALQLAVAHGDRGSELCLRLFQAEAHLYVDPSRAPELEALIEEALPLFEASDNDYGLSLAWFAVLLLGPLNGLVDDALEAAEHALEHAHRADRPTDAMMLMYFGMGRYEGTTPISELLAWLDAQEQGDRRNPLLYVYRALALATLGRFDEARALLDATLADVGGLGRNWAAIATGAAVDLELLAGNPAAAVELAERACRQLEQAENAIFFSWVLLRLARAQYDLGQLDDAEANIDRALEISGSGARVHQTFGLPVKAKILARRGKHAEAERIGCQAVAIADKTQELNGQADAYADLAETLTLIGKPDSAREASTEALARYQRKGNLVGARRAQAMLAELEPAASRAAR